MRIPLNTSQILAISDFSLDVAKGLMLAGILGQGFVTVDSNFVRVMGSIMVIFMSVSFLFFGVQLRKKVKK